MRASLREERKKARSALSLLLLIGLSSIASVVFIVLPSATNQAHASVFGIDVHNDNSAASNTVNVAITTTIANDVIVVYIGAEDAGSGTSPTVTVTDNLGGHLTWNHRLHKTFQNLNGGTFGNSLDEYWAAWSSSGAITITATWNMVTPFDTEIAATAFSGTNTASPFDINAAVPASAVSSTAVSSIGSTITTTASTDILIGALRWNEGSDGNATGPSGFTTLNSIVHGGAWGIQTNYQIESSPLSSVTETYSWSGGTAAAGTIMDAMRSAPFSCSNTLSHFVIGHTQYVKNCYYDIGISTRTGLINFTSIMNGQNTSAVTGSNPGGLLSTEINANIGGGAYTLDNGATVTLAAATSNYAVVTISGQISGMVVAHYYLTFFNNSPGVVAVVNQTLVNSNFNIQHDIYQWWTPSWLSKVVDMNDSGHVQTITASSPRQDNAFSQVGDSYSQVLNTTGPEWYWAGNVREGIGFQILALNQSGGSAGNSFIQAETFAFHETAFDWSGSHGYTASDPKMTNWGVSTKSVATMLMYLNASQYQSFRTFASGFLEHGYSTTQTASTWSVYNSNGHFYESAGGQWGITGTTSYLTGYDLSDSAFFGIWSATGSTEGQSLPIRMTLTKTNAGSVNLATNSVFTSQTSLTNTGTSSSIRAVYNDTTDGFGTTIVSSTKTGTDKINTTVTVEVTSGSAVTVKNLFFTGTIFANYLEGGNPAAFSSSTNTTNAKYSWNYTQSGYAIFPKSGCLQESASQTSFTMYLKTGSTGTSEPHGTTFTCSFWSEAYSPLSTAHNGYSSTVLQTLIHYWSRYPQGNATQVGFQNIGNFFQQAVKVEQHNANKTIARAQFYTALPKTTFNLYYAGAVNATMHFKFSNGTTVLASTYYNSGNKEFRVPVSTASAITSVTFFASTSTEIITVTMGAGPVTTITITGCSPSYVNGTFTTAHSHTFTVAASCAISYGPPANSTNIRYIFTGSGHRGTWAYTTAASGSETKSNTLYEQLQNTYGCHPLSPSTFDGIYACTATGTSLGTGSSTISTVNTSNGGGTVSASGWSDYNTAVSLPTGFGSWVFASTRTWTDTTGGNSHTTDYTVPASTVTEVVTITVGAGPVITITIGGSCSPSYVNGTFTTAHSHTFTATPSCAISYLPPANSTNIQYVFTGHHGTWAYTTAASGTDTKSNTLYEQLQNTYRATPTNPIAWDAILSITVSGTIGGTGSTTGCTLSTVVSGGAVTCSAFFDYNTQVTIQSPVTVNANERWAQGCGAGGNQFTQTTGGNIDNCNYVMELQQTATIAANAQTLFDSGMTCTVTGTLAGTGSTTLATITTTAAATNTAAYYADYNTVATFCSSLTGAPANSQWAGVAPFTFTYTTGGNVPTVQYWKQWTNNFKYSVTGGGSPTAPVLTCNQFGTPATLGLTLSNQAFYCDHSASATGTNPTTGSTGSERWSDNGQSSTITGGGATITFVYYHQYSALLKYTIIGGGSPTAPTLTSTQFGASYTPALTTSATTYWLDNGQSWSVTNPLTGSSGTERWQTSQTTSGTVGVSSPGPVTWFFYHQFHNTFGASPTSNGNQWDAVLGITVNGTQFGAGVTGCTIATTIGGGAVNCAAFFDASALVTVQSPVAVSGSEQWAASSPNTFTPGTGGNTVTVSYVRQWLLTMGANPSNCGTTAPQTSFQTDGASIGGVSATGVTGCTFLAWTGTGTGSYTGPANPTTVTMTGPISETAGFIGQPLAYCVQAVNVVQNGTSSFALLAALFAVMAGGTVIAAIVMVGSKEGGSVMPLVFMVLLMGTVIMLVFIVFGASTATNDSLIRGIGCTPQ